MERDALGWPHNLTHCCECDQPFDEPVEAWDDYFTDIEDAAFACKPCGEREGYPVDPMSADMEPTIPEGSRLLRDVVDDLEERGL